MKSVKTKLVSVLACSALVLLSSCEVPSWSGSKKVNPGSNEAVELKSYDALEIKPVDAKLGKDFMRGFDASEVKALEEAGVKFYDENNAETDIFKILSDNGVNWIRLRLWNDYTKELDADWAPYGYNNLDRTLSMAKRAKRFGMKVLLDFHYSDNWADPAKQKCPDMWKEIDNVFELSKAVADWTESVLLKMKQAGCAPDMVQLGNENESQGIFQTNTAVSLTVSDKASILDEASKKVRAVLPECKIMLHMSRGGNSGVLASFLSDYVSKVDCDVVGLSYYPYYESHGTITGLQKNIETIKAAGKEACVAELSYAYSLTEWCDNTNNTFGDESFEENSAKAITTYVGIKSGKISATIDNQAGVIREVIEKTAQKGGSGVFYWGGAYLGVDDVMNSAWENQCLFDVNGKVLPSLKVMAVSGK